MRGRLIVIALVVTSVVFLPAPADAGDGNYPIVLIPGWHGNADTFREMIPKLVAQGFTVLDFDSATPGIQAMGYAPTAAGQHIPYVAGMIVEEKIQAALAAAGYPSTQKVDIVAHSMGGLVARFLIEKPGADVDSWSDASGWFGDGVADVRTDWASRVDDLVMLGTPNHGTWEGWVPATIGGFGNWNPTGGDMFGPSKFLSLMGYAEKAGETYRCVGGNPQYLQWLQFNYDGDSVAHGFDGVVPAESPFVTGCTMDYVAGHHGELVTTDQAVDLVITMLGQTSYQAGVGQANLAGDLVVRLEKLSVAQDHDSGTTDDYVVDTYVDPDSTLGSAGYTLVGSVHYGMNGPGTANWGNTGPSSSALKLGGKFPVVDVKVVVREDDTSWGGGYESVSTHYFTNLLLSEDVDGQDYYKATATDSKGGTNEVRVSLNGVTADVSLTRYVTLGYDKTYVEDDHDCCGNGETQYTLNAGRAGFTSVIYRGDPGTDTHYSREDPAWVNIGTDTKNNGAVESEVIWSGRMHKDAQLRFDITYWEDDGGWSARDGGNMYYLDTPLSSIIEGRTNYQGTSLPDFNTYIWVDKAGNAGSGSGGIGFAGDVPMELDAWLAPTSLVPNGPDDVEGQPFHPAGTPLAVETTLE
ncbi:MAG TPA: hypothetical protein VM370_05105 [Candidatus Thermoplasmatota archaeon]|nr:hypothetical protein [Candidatus Thermoplasmatota archaeon]